MKSFFQQSHPCRPEFPFAAGVICGCAYSSSQGLLIVSAAVTGAFLFSKRAGSILCAGVLCGMTALMLHSIILSLAQRQLPQRDAGVSLTCRAIDSRITHLPDVPKPSFFTAQIIEVNGKKSRFRNKVLVRLKETSSIPQYGEIFSGTGPLLHTDPDSRFGRFLKARNIFRIWHPDSIETRKAPAGIMFQLTRIRDRLLARCIDGIGSDRAKIIAGAMFFGISGGFDPQMRSSYINSGTLHLFSISGMHLTVIAFLFLNCLRLIPRKAKFFLTAVFLTVYALTTGANPPVMRALIILLLWIAGKIFYFYKDSFDLLALAAAVLFLANPSLIYDIGVWYSLFITAAVILYGKRMQDFISPGFKVIKALPKTKETEMIFKDLKRSWKIVFAAGFCLIAFAAGIAISAVNGNLIVPGAIFINLILLFFVPVLFAAASLKVIAGSLFPAGILEKFLLVLHDLCTEGANLSVPLVPALPPLTEAVVFCLLLLAALNMESERIRRWAAVLAAAVFILWMLRPAFSPPAAAIISGDCNTPPVIVLCEPREDLAFIVNASDRKSVEKAVHFLLQNGIKNPEVLLFSSTSVSAASAAGDLMQSAPPKRIRLPDHSYGRLKAKLSDQGICDLSPGGREREFMQFFRENSQNRLEYFNPGSKLNLRIEWIDTPRGRDVSVDRTAKYRIPWGNTPEVIVHEFVRK